MIPINIIYWMSFSYLEKQRLIAINEACETFFDGIDEDEVVYLNDNAKAAQLKSNEDVDSLVNQSLNIYNLKKLWPKIGYFLINLGLVKS